MINSYTRFFGSLFLYLFSIHSFAGDTIRITVTTSKKTAAAIGYSVEGKDSGGVGKSYTGKGPKNKKYSFGYRNHSVKSPDISCGTLTLTKDSTVNLVTRGNKCKSVLK